MSDQARTSSLRFRITALATVVVLSVLGVASVVLVLVNRRVLTDSLDESLSRRADEIATLIAAGQLPDTGVNLGDDDTIAQVIVTDGAVAWSSAASQREAFIASPAQGAGSVRTVSDIGADGSRFRVVLQPTTFGSTAAVIEVAGSLDEIDQATTVLAVSLAIAVPLVAIALASTTWWLVGRTLRPVEGIRTEVAAIGGSDLRRRVPEPARRDEIGRLARTMNDMLDRVEESAEREQRFVADASHELRSPLTRIRSQLEVGLAHPGTTDSETTERRVLDETIEMQRLVDDLLHLARGNAGADPVDRHQPVDLDDLVLRHVERLRAESSLEIWASGVGAAQVLGDRRALHRAIGNVADNAARHAARSITFDLAEDHGDALLTISDDGLGIPTDERERVFERFARLDDARSVETGGAGLGLSIARDIVDRHHGAMSIESSNDGGTRLAIRIPLANTDLPAV